MPLSNDPLHGTTSGDVLTPRAAHRQLPSGLDGDDVAFLQGRLNQDGASPPLTVDGHFRGGTRTAVFEFQRRHGLRPDGIVGPQTWGLIDELARAGIAGAHDVMGETAAVTQDEATAIAAHMGSAAPTGPPMTVAGYEAEIVAALDAYYDREPARADADRRSRASPTPAASATSHSASSTTSTPTTSSWPRARATCTSYHPGNFVLPVADAASRPVDPVFARMWVQLDMLPAAPAPGRPVPGDVSFAHNVDTRRPEDEARVREIADRYLQTGRMPKVIRYIRAYPAEVSTGTAFLGLRASHWLRGDGPPPPITPPVLRQAMWDLLSGLMHEYLHKAAHAHFTETAERMGGQAGRVLIEGFCDYFRVQAWDALMPRFLSDAACAPRSRARTAWPRTARSSPLDPDVIVPHRYYPSSPGDRDRPGPRRRPARRGQRARRVLHGPRRPARHRTRDPRRARRRQPRHLGPRRRGDRRPLRRARGRRARPRRLGAHGQPHGPGRGRPLLRPGRRDDRVAAATRLRVRGIRHVRATSNDTRGQIAGQNGVSLHALERANHWSPGLGSTPVAAGTRVLVPQH